MKPFIVNKSSWHYRLAYFVEGDTLEYRAPSDFCSYTRMVMWSMMLCTIMAAVLGFVLWPVIDFLVWLGQVTFAGHWIGMRGASQVFVGFAFIASIFSLCVYGREKYRDWVANKPRAERNAPKDPGFLKMWYRSFKGKFCMQIEFREDK